MNKSCNLIYIAGLILINCSNAADGYKPLPDPVYKSPPASDVYKRQSLYRAVWRVMLTGWKILNRGLPVKSVLFMASTALVNPTSLSVKKA